MMQRTFSGSWASVAGAFLLALGLSACGSSFLYEEKKDIPEGGWTYADTLDFRFSVADTSKLYNLYLEFEYADSFATHNLYVKLHTRFPDGKRLDKQKSFDLFDPAGQALGQCSGRRCRLRTLLQENTYFNQPGEYLITLEQYMRRDSLPGIFAAGVALQESEKAGK